MGGHSEVGKLRKVIVHRPDLSLQRLTPANHDELLFDDVLWVEQAQREHDAFVGVLRERGVEVFYVHDLLAETLAASDEARRKLIEAVASPYTVGWSATDEVRDYLSGLDPQTLAKHLIGGMTVAEAGLDWGAAAQGLADRGGASRMPRRSSSRRCRTRSSCVTPPAGSTTASRSTRCTGRRGGAKRSTCWRSTAITRCSATPGSTGGIRELGDEGQFDVTDFGRATLEGGDVQPIGNGTVLIGMSERTQGRMIEQIAKALFARGAAERVIACVMGKDRAHMHLDTVFTMLDRDKVTAYPKVVSEIRAISLRPGRKEGDFHVTVEKDFLSACRTPGREEADRRRDGRRQVPARARAMGRRQQHRRARAGVVVAYERNTYTIAKMRNAGVEVIPFAASSSARAAAAGTA